MTILNADKWLKTKLSGDATITGVVSTRIYEEQAPQTATYPLITIQQYAASEPLTNVGADAVMDAELWQVMIVTDKPSYSTLETVADRIRAVLHKSTGTGVLACEFTGAQRLAEAVSGVKYRTIVLEFRIYTQ